MQARRREFDRDRQQNESYIKNHNLALKIPHRAAYQRAVRIEKAVDELINYYVILSWGLIQSSHSSSNSWLIRRAHASPHHSNIIFTRYLNLGCIYHQGCWVKIGNDQGCLYKTVLNSCGHPIDLMLSYAG